MKKFLIFFLLATFSFSSFSQSKSSSDVYVKSYTRSNGTVVKGYYRTAPNSTNRDNFSTRGNVNPYTGKKGYVKPDNKPYSSAVRSNNYSGSSTTSSPNDGKIAAVSNSSVLGKNTFQDGTLFYSKYGIEKSPPVVKWYRGDPTNTRLLTLNDLEINFNGSGQGKIVFYKKGDTYSYNRTTRDWEKSKIPIEFEKIRLDVYKYGKKTFDDEYFPFGGFLKIEASNMVLENDKYIFIDDGIATFTGHELDIILERNIVLTLKNIYKGGKDYILYYVFSPSQQKVLSMFNVK